MLAGNREHRYATPDAAMSALLPFLEGRAPNGVCAPREPHVPAVAGAGTTHQVLIVDDEAGLRKFCRMGLESAGLQCEEACSGAEALQILEQQPCDLVILDVNMPDIQGTEVLRTVREHPPYAHLKIVMSSGTATADEMAQLLLAGADDYLPKPFSMGQLQGRVQAALRLKDAQDNATRLNQQLGTGNAELERRLAIRSFDATRANHALILILTKLVELRDVEKGSHLARLRRYCRGLAEAAMQVPAFAGQLNVEQLELLECCAPLHDIGKIALPDHIVFKPGKLDATERMIMEAHPSIGSDILQQVAEQYGWDAEFLRMATEIVRHHHERYDGTGYPDRLAGDAIPLAARIVALADRYDALRSRRSYRPGLSHAIAVQSILRNSPGHFDPQLVDVFEGCADQLELVFGGAPD